MSVLCQPQTPFILSLSTVSIFSRGINSVSRRDAERAGRAEWRFPSRSEFSAAFALSAPLRETLSALRVRATI
jgi:hypothetical protein